MKSLVLLSLVALPLAAQSDMDKRLAELEKKVQQLTQESEQPKAKLMNQAEVERKLPPVGLKGFYDGGYLVAQSANGDFKYWLDGRLQLDSAFYSGSKTRLANGAELRRMRLGLKTTLFRDWISEIDVDFADNAVEIKDAWLGYGAWKDSLLRVGNFRVPFGMDTLTSSKNIWFMERAYLDCWAPDRKLGVAYSKWFSHGQFSGGLFGQDIATSKDATGISRGYTYALRGSFAPLAEPTKAIHFGLAASRQKPDAASPSMKLVNGQMLNEAQAWSADSRAETHVSRVKFLQTGTVKYIDNVQLTGLEFAGVFGPFSWQSEYQMVQANRQGGLEALKYKGAYGQISYFFKGFREYSVSEGEMDRVIPASKSGYWEVALRYSTIDFNNKDLAATDPHFAARNGGKAANVTLGLTWYMNANFKMMLNVTKVDHDDYAKPTKTAFMPDPTKPSNYINDDFNIVGIRFALAF